MVLGASSAGAAHPAMIAGAALADAAAYLLRALAVPVDNWSRVASFLRLTAAVLEAHDRWLQELQALTSGHLQAEKQVPRPPPPAHDTPHLPAAQDGHSRATLLSVAANSQSS